MNRLNADLALLFSAAIWGTAFVLQKSAMDHIGPLTFVAARCTDAALALAPFAWLEIRRSPELGGGTLGAFSPGDRLVMLSAVLWAAHVVITGRASPFRRPIGFTALQFAIVAALAAVGAAVLETPTTVGPAAAAIDVAYVGLLSSALTFTLLTVALEHTPPSEAAVIVSLETVFAASAGYLALGERLDGLGLSGAGLILLAVLCIQLGPALAARHQPR